MDVKTKLRNTRKYLKMFLVAIHKIKTTLTLNKLAYVGIIIFEFSKISTYEFHYDYIKN